jgi:hypothetical protein
VGTSSSIKHSSSFILSSSSSGVPSFTYPVIRDLLLRSASGENFVKQGAALQKKKIEIADFGVR